jgi:RNA recognition motif-containing protein
MQGSQLYVGNLNYSVVNDDLQELFSNYGLVEEVKVIEGKGFGFVEMSTQAEAEKAKEALSGFDLWR